MEAKYDYTRLTFSSFIRIFYFVFYYPLPVFSGCCDVETTRLIVMLPGLAVYSF